MTNADIAEMLKNYGALLSRYDALVEAAGKVKEAADLCVRSVDDHVAMVTDDEWVRQNLAPAIAALAELLGEPNNVKGTQR